MLIPRLLTGIIGGALLLGAIYVGGVGFYLVILGISLVALREFYALCRGTGYAVSLPVGLIGGFLITTSIYLNGVSWGALTDNQGTALVLALLILALVIQGLVKGPSNGRVSEWSVTLFGMLFVSGALAHLILLREMRPMGQMATFLLFGIVWAADTCAYTVGMRWGKHPLAASISPKKTWEGLAGGLVGAIFVALLFHACYFKAALGIPEAIGLAAVMTIIALASDLAESLIKRGADAKDSSNLLPGHGGLLDRFDAFLLAAPFYYYYWAFFKHG